MISNFLHYQFSLAALLLKRDISFATWRRATKDTPIVVLGKRGGFVVDQTIDMTKHELNARAVIQFIVGSLFIAGAIGWLANAISIHGFNGAALPEAITAAVIIGVGLVAVLDATLSLQPLERRNHHADHT